MQYMEIETKYSVFSLLAQNFNEQQRFGFISHLLHFGTTFPRYISVHFLTCLHLKSRIGGSKHFRYRSTSSIWDYKVKLKIINQKKRNKYNIFY